MSHPDQTTSNQLKPEILWDPRIVVNADNWDALHEQGWDYSHDRSYSGNDRTIRIAYSEGEDTVLQGNLYITEIARPLSDEEQYTVERNLKKPGPSDLSSWYFRPGLYALQTQSWLHLSKNEVETYDYFSVIESPGGIQFDLAKIENPFQKRRMHDAALEGLFDEVMSGRERLNALNDRARQLALSAGRSAVKNS